ncbi:MAG: 2-oxoglutarate dehydrogenase complex dihydrolipoyllysine-residue succinyltransferase [Pseudomonadales bacterium]|nr:2-oxoglutarate dehydrogenase complex dihydrolipoyllysine-residue succinyltransferase [Pseudomonadales bacterium]MBO6658888.1 2-oxoglutarate dehydrogenase complex dihydrolipoyllysine-residue succinyltransferase [Pseudomonadales bacterium]MBO6701522.1 2-oxoglutarate dehydrogenase complex dihydrolipoyllysine-residue succinyltransferase [Pseudomonadales bacterium]MBO7007341.1 2-oxoglutarate dehydrogenase complex dihydrolipoyllysine-residue succinyltransferase [Pseudomonadales bacterium]
MVEIKAPQFPESIADGEVATWHVAVGETAHRDQVLVDIETDKVVLEVVAPRDGRLTAIHKQEGDTVLAEEVLGEFEPGEVSSDAPSPASAPAVEETALTPEPAVAEPASSVEIAGAGEDTIASPAAKKMAEENRIDVTRIAGTGKGGRVTKEDVLKAVAEAQGQMAEKQTSASMQDLPSAADGNRIERRVPMTRLRASIAKRLVDAQQTAAMLTTFNEIDMRAIMDLRAQYKDDFAKVHNGTRLGFMSFFIRASVEALKRFPAVNASIDGSDIVYHGYQDIGVAVGSPRGLVVPVIRDADSLTLAELEEQVSDYGKKAQEGKLSIDEMTGGTFTVSNGGVFGSLLSTPILNPPQTGILGMHKIQERPMAINGEVVIRPMMYVALSYDHRLIDGQEAVRFLVTIKDFLEEPARILLDI